MFVQYYFIQLRNPHVLSISLSPYIYYTSQSPLWFAVLRHCLDLCTVLRHCLGLCAVSRHCIDLCTVLRHCLGLCAVLRHCLGSVYIIALLSRSVHNIASLSRCVYSITSLSLSARSITSLSRSMRYDVTVFAVLLGRRCERQHPGVGRKHHHRVAVLGRERHLST